MIYNEESWEVVKPYADRVMARGAFLSDEEIRALVATAVDLEQLKSVIAVLMRTEKATFAEALASVAPAVKRDILGGLFQDALTPKLLFRAEESK